MISWTIPGTVARLTGATTVSGSSSSSSSGQAQGSGRGPNIDSNGLGQPFSNVANGSASAEGFSSYLGSTLHAGSGSTTYFSYTFSSTYTEQWNRTDDLTPEAQTNTNNVYTGPTTAEYTSSSSTSGSSFNITTAAATALAETSTTYSYLQAYQVTSVATAEEPMDAVWTSSSVLYNETKTSIVFQTTAGTRTSSLGVGQSQRTVIEDVATALNETITLSALPDTVLQAQTRYNESAEIVYAITQNISEVSAFSAATALAVSGTRLTISPRLQTAEKIQVNATRPTSSFASSEITSNFEIINSTTTAGTRTTAQYVSFPPVTGTQATNLLTTTQSQVGVNTLEFQIDETYGESTETVTAKDFATYSVSLMQQVGSLTFHTTRQSASTYTVTQTVEAAASSSTKAEEDGTLVYVIWFGEYSAQGGSASATERSSAISANTALPTAKVVTGQGFQPAQIKYGSIGAAIDNNVGGFLTANASSVGFVFSEDIYAKDGGHRSATTMFPATNQWETIEGNSITWTTSTSGILSVDGATSKRTTTSAEVGVSGVAQTATLSRAISNFGGSAGEGETFVQTALPGVYKNKINGATTSFDGSASVVSNGQSQPIAMWRSIVGVTGMVSSTDANPVTWAEQRNSSDLPPTMPPNA